MFCEKCGNQMSGSSKFCESCGSPSKVNSQQENQPAGQSAPPVRQSAPQVQQSAPVMSPPQSPHPYMPPVQSSYAPAQSYSGNNLNTPLSVLQYIGMFFLLLIPIVNIVLLFVWGFGSNVNLNKKNFARASLIISAISIVLYFILGAIFIAALGSMFNGMY